MDWANVAEADIYFTDTLDDVAWSTDVSLKSPSLGQARKDILADNTLSLPSEVSESMQTAQMELAVYYVRQFTEFGKRRDLQNASVSNFKLKDWEEQFHTPIGRLPDLIYAILNEYRGGSTIVNLC